MREQQTIVAPLADSVPETQKIPKEKNAISRVPELLSERSRLRREFSNKSKELEKLRGEMLDVLTENSDLKGREEQRLWQAEENAKAARQVAEDHRLLCFRAVIDCAHQTGFYETAPDFDSRLKRAEHLFSTDLLEEILCFPPESVGPMMYALSSNHDEVRKLSWLGAIPAIFWLCKMAGEIGDRVLLGKEIGR